MYNIKSFAVTAAALLLVSCTNAAEGSADKAEDISSHLPETTVSQTAEIRTAQPDEDRDTAVTSAVKEYPAEYELEINEPDAPQITGVSLRVKQPEGMCRLENVYSTDVIAAGTVGLVGCPIAVGLEARLGELTFTVDPDNLGSVPAENLAVLKSGQGKSFGIIPSRTEGSSVSCQITESDTYMLVDVYQWSACWDNEPAGVAHETEFVVGDGFDFRVTLPESVTPSGVSALWEKTAAEGSYQVMTKQLLFQNNQSSAPIKAELTAYRYPNEEDGCDSPLPPRSFDDKIREIASISSDMFTLETSEPWDIGRGRRGFMAVFRFPGEPDKGIDEQTTVEAFYEYSDDTYILFALSFKGHDQTMTDNCIKSIKSFTYL